MGKRVLHTQISEEEHAFLRRMADRQSMTMTMYLRSLIRARMSRPDEEPWVKETGQAGPGESAR